MQTMERETGFHEGIQFALEVVERALVKNPDIPMLAFQTAKKILIQEDK